MLTPKDFDPKRIAKDFGPILKKLRKENKLTHKELARRAGCSTKHVSELERSNKAPSFSTFLKLGCCLGITHIEFLDLLLKEIESAIGDNTESIQKEDLGHENSTDPSVS